MFLTNKHCDKERRDMMRQLMVYSAIPESVSPVKDMDGEEIKALLRQISSLPVVSNILKPTKDDERDTGPLEPCALLYSYLR